MDLGSLFSLILAVVAIFLAGYVWYLASFSATGRPDMGIEIRFDQGAPPSNKIKLSVDDSVYYVTTDTDMLTPPSSGTKLAINITKDVGSNIAKLTMRVHNFTNQEFQIKLDDFRGLQTSTKIQNVTAPSNLLTVKPKSKMTQDVFTDFMSISASTFTSADLTGNLILTISS